MGYLLDTCVLAEFKQKQPGQKVIDWLDVQIEEAFSLSVVTIGEIQRCTHYILQSIRPMSLR
jgi:predicted nucleic acid-binding protein